MSFTINKHSINYKTIGTAGVAIFSERLFVSSIIRKIYQIDQTRENIVASTAAKNKPRLDQSGFDNLDIERVQNNDANSRISKNESVLYLAQH